jgi:hypothetical protein
VVNIESFFGKELKKDLFSLDASRTLDANTMNGVLVIEPQKSLEMGHVFCGRILRCSVFAATDVIERLRESPRKNRFIPSRRFS